MKSLVFCLGSLREPRVHAGLRRDYPLLYLVPPFIAGQLAGSTGWIWGIPVAALAILKLERRSILRAAVISAVVGILSVAAREPVVPLNLPGEGESVLVEVLGAPRRPRVGEIRFRAVARRSGEADPLRIQCAGVDLPWRNLSRIRTGDRVLIRGKFKPVVRSLNPFTYAATLRRDGVQARCTVGTLTIVARGEPPLRDRLSSALRRRVESVLGTGERAGLVLSMGLGVRDVLSERTEAAFKATGLAHLLVVSGYQVTLVYGSVLLLLRSAIRRLPRILALQRSEVAAGWLAFAFSITFIYVVGIEGSTMRAGLALLFCLVIRQSERRGGMFNGILASLAVISALWPGSVCEPGVELTFAALTGIALGSTRGKPFLLSTLSVTFFATTATALISLLWFGVLSLAGFLLNPVVAPLLGVVSCEGGFLAIAAHAMGLDPSGLGLWAVSGALEAGRDIVIRAATLPFASIEPEGRWYQGTAVVLGCLLVGRIIYKFNQWVIESGLDFYATRRPLPASKPAEGLPQFKQRRIA